MCGSAAKCFTLLISYLILFAAEQVELSGFIIVYLFWNIALTITPKSMWQSFDEMQSRIKFQTVKRNQFPWKKRQNMPSSLRFQNKHRNGTEPKKKRLVSLNRWADGATHNIPLEPCEETTVIDLQGTLVVFWIWMAEHSRTEDQNATCRLMISYCCTV